MGFSLVAVSGDCSLLIVHRLLTVVASLAGEHRLQGMWASVAAAYEAQWLWLLGFRAQAW